MELESEAAEIKREIVAKNELAIQRALRGTAQNGPDFKALR